jgi:hypothetical protein
MTHKGEPVADFDTATLPEELQAYGQPLSIHRPWAAAIEDVQRKLLSALGGLTWNLSGPAFEQWVLLILGAFLLAGGFVALGFYFYRPPKNEDPIFVLITAVGAFVLGGVTFGLGVFRTRLGSGAGAGSKATTVRRIFVVYEAGLAVVEGDAFEFMRWRDVKELGNTWVRLSLFLTLTDTEGRRIVIDNGLTDSGTLSLALHQRVNDVLLPKALKRIEAGKWVSFGPFKVSKAGMKYKDRSTSWDDVKSMEIHTRGLDRRLTIHCYGRLMRWCWYNLTNVPNDGTFLDVLSRTAPERLLIPSKRPRW